MRLFYVMVALRRKSATIASDPGVMNVVVVSLNARAKLLALSVTRVERVSTILSLMNYSDLVPQLYVKVRKIMRAWVEWGLRVGRDRLRIAPTSIV